MGQVIRISDGLFQRLEAHATGFDTPARVIERILNQYEGLSDSTHQEIGEESASQASPSQHLDIYYYAGSEEIFKEQLLETRMGYIKIFYSDGKTEITPWSAHQFSPTSRVDGNLRSGRLRGWKQRGIVRAELTVDQNDFT